MRYDEKEKTFVVGPKVGTEGLQDDFESNFLFNDDKGMMTFRGPMNLMSSKPNTYLLASGSARVNVDSAAYRINALLALTFALPEPVNAVIANKLVEGNLEEQNSDAADDDLNRLSDKLLPLIGQKAVDEYRAKAQNQHVSLALASPKLNAAMVLANTNLRWSEKFNAFYSVGKLGVSNLHNVDINAQMDGYVEIRKGGNGDELSLYIAASDEVWAFYDYHPTGNGGGGQLAIITSDQETNDRLTALLNNNKGKSPLQIVPAAEDEKALFVERYEAQYRVRAKPVAKPKPKPGTKPTAAEAAVAKEDDGFGGEEEVAPAKKPAKGAKPAPTRTTAKSKVADPAAGESTETGDAQPAKKPTVVKGKYAGADATKKPAVVAKKEPVKKEPKKDKEDEKEGF